MKGWWREAKPWSPYLLPFAPGALVPLSWAPLTLPHCWYFHCKISSLPPTFQFSVASGPEHPSSMCFADQSHGWEARMLIDMSLHLLEKPVFPAVRVPLRFTANAATCHLVLLWILKLKILEQHFLFLLLCSPFSFFKIIVSIIAVVFYQFGCGSWNRTKVELWQIILFKVCLKNASSKQPTAECYRHSDEYRFYEQCVQTKDRAYMNREGQKTIGA